MIKNIIYYFLFLIYIITIGYTYALFVTQIFPEYPHISFTFIKLLESLALLFLLLATLPQKWKKPSSFFYTLLVLTVIIPMHAIYVFNNVVELQRIYFYVVHLSVIIIFIITNSIKIKFPMYGGSPNIILIILFAFGSLTYAHLVYIAHNHLVLNLKDVYEVRLQMREIVGGVWGYFQTWLAKVILPFLLTISVYKKRTLFVFITVILCISMFVLTSHKSYAIYPFAILLIYIIFQFNNHSLIILTLGVLGINIFVLLYVIFGDLTGLALFVQRAIYKPAFLNFFWVDVFKDLDWICLSHSKINPFMEYPYSHNPPYLVGEALRGSVDTRSNTSFLGTGFANFGFLGVVIFSFIVGFLLKILDIFSKNWPVCFSSMIAFVPFNSLLRGGDLFSSFLTHGILMILILIWCFRLEKFNLKIKLVN